MPQVVIENQPTELLSKEENEQVFTLLGVRCQTIATAVVQLFITEPPSHTSWIKRDTGILCFVKDSFRKNYFFRLYCLRRNCQLWEQELYTNIEYLSPCDFFHTFEGDEYMVAFNFANVPEARNFKTVVDRKVIGKRRREEKRHSRGITVTQDQSPRLPTSNDLDIFKKASVDMNDRLTKRRRNLTKADIGNPSEFRHVSHVGWHPDKGFDIARVDPQLKAFFSRAGVSEKQLQDKETRAYIYNFINNHGGMEAAVQNIPKDTTKKMAPAPPPSSNTGPPVPPRTSARPHNRAAPPPPPTSTQNNWTSQPTNSYNSNNNNAAQNIPPPPLGIAPPPPVVSSAPPSGVAMAPPPPPLPPPPMEQPPCPPALPAMPPPQSTDMRSALMENIRQGTTLKPVENEKRPDSNGGRDDLLKEIREGIRLKPVDEREVKPVSPVVDHCRGDLASALAKALADRSRVIHSEDDSTSDTDSNDDEWDA